jgi:hypothetical protein
LCCGRYCPHARGGHTGKAAGVEGRTTPLFNRSSTRRALRLRIIQVANSQSSKHGCPLGSSMSHLKGHYRERWNEKRMQPRIRPIAAPSAKALCEGPLATLDNTLWSNSEERNCAAVHFRCNR